MGLWRPGIKALNNIRKFDRINPYAFNRQLLFAPKRIPRNPQLDVTKYTKDPVVRLGVGMMALGWMTGVVSLWEQMWENMAAGKYVGNGLWENILPDNWIEQPPLPTGLEVNISGQFGTDGAWVQGRVTYERSDRVDDGCGSPRTISNDWGGRQKVTSTGGQLRYVDDGPSGTGCGGAGYRVDVLRTMPSVPNNADWLGVRGVSIAGWVPEGGIRGASFDIRFEPDGEPVPTLPQPSWEPSPPVRPPTTPEQEPDRRSVPPPTPPIRPQRMPTPVRPTPVREPAPDTPPRPVPGPDVAPSPQRAPSPTPLPSPAPTPSPTPGGQPQTEIGTALTNAARVATAITPAAVRTPTRARFPVSGGPSVTTSGPRASVGDVALEMGRIERKIDFMLNADQTWNPNWITLLWAALQALEPLLDWLDQEDGWPGAEYTLTEDCGDLPEGADPVQRSVVVPPAEQIGDYLVNQFAAMAQLQQFHLQLRQPICRRRVEPEGQSVTVSFESDEVGLGGRAPLRKYLRYRCRPGTTLEQLANHWRDFTWQAGPVISIHTGAPWGRLQVWAASEDEGRRVIRHAGETSGVDPDRDGEWLTTGTDHARYGQAGTMRVARRQGFLKVTTRDSPNGLPLVSD